MSFAPYALMGAPQSPFPLSPESQAAAKAILPVSDASKEAPPAIKMIPLPNQQAQSIPGNPQQVPWRELAALAGGGSTASDTVNRTDPMAPVKYSTGIDPVLAKNLSPLYKAQETSIQNDGVANTLTIMAFAKAISDANNAQEAAYNAMLGIPTAMAALKGQRDAVETAAAQNSADMQNHQMDVVTNLINAEKEGNTPHQLKTSAETRSRSVTTGNASGAAGQVVGDLSKGVVDLKKGQMAATAQDPSGAGTYGAIAQQGIDQAKAIRGDQGVNSAELANAAAKLRTATTTDALQKELEAARTANPNLAPALEEAAAIRQRALTNRDSPQFAANMAQAEEGLKYYESRVKTLQENPELMKQARAFHKQVIDNIYNPLKDSPDEPNNPVVLTSAYRKFHDRFVGLTKFLVDKKPKK